MHRFKITIIIPTLNERDNISLLLSKLALQNKNEVEIIVVDGGSTDGTLDEVKKFNTVKLISSEVKSRAVQMNLGAKYAKYNILYFVHADVTPLDCFYEDIYDAITEGYDFGCYRFKFDKDHLMLRFNAFFTRFKPMFCRGGDQTIFIKKDAFNALNGFNEEFCIMEDFDFIKRAKKRLKFKIIPKSVTVSSRKYNDNSYFKVNRVNLIAYWMFKLQYSPKKIRTFYKKSLTMNYE